MTAPCVPRVRGSEGHAGSRVTRHEQHGDVALRVEVDDVRPHDRAVGPGDGVGGRARDDVGVGDDVAVADGKSAAGDDAAAAEARDLDHDRRRVLHAGRVDRGRDRQGARQAAWLEAREHRGELHAGEDLGDAGEKGGRSRARWCPGRAGAAERWICCAISGLGPAGKAEAQEPAHDEDGERRQGRAGRRSRSRCGRRCGGCCGGSARRRRTRCSSRGFRR